ncbi:MAG: YdcF family protein, partial [Candidatus Andersenbacteria bacterium]|nr:YdcF family protein [Candidatus Andersenbacteria bacterium]
MKFFKKIFLAVVAGLIIAIFAILAINFYINLQSKAYIFQGMNDLPEAEVALVLGAKVYQQGIMSGMLEDRVETAFDLYKKGKVEKILISGDHGREDYDEVNTVKDHLLNKGVDRENIFLDHAGFDTYDSL